MKASSKFMFLVLPAFFLAACGANAAQEDAVLSNSYTAAAETLAAQPDLTTPTATTSPAAFTFPTAAPVAPASPSLVSYSSASTASGCNSSLYVSDVTIPDGTILAPGESFVKTWKLQNTGTCAWSESYLLIFVSGKEMDGETTEIGEEVASGSTGEVSVTLVAPSSDGTYTGYWRLADEDGNVFGQSVYVMIVVSDDASTLTPTSTEEVTESTSTPTTAPAATETFTSTPAPTATAVPTETDTPATVRSE